jgi:hypothetical protein
MVRPDASRLLATRWFSLSRFGDPVEVLLVKRLRTTTA